MSNTIEKRNNKSVSYLQPKNPQNISNKKRYSCREKESPDYLSNLPEQLEQHQALQKFYSVALLAIANSEEYKDNEDWQYGAFLLSKNLAQKGDKLVEKLSKKFE